MQEIEPSHQWLLIPILVRYECFLDNDVGEVVRAAGISPALVSSCCRTEQPQARLSEATSKKIGWSFVGMGGGAFFIILSRVILSADHQVMCEVIDMMTFYQQITDGQLTLSSVSSMSTGFSWRRFISLAK